MNSRFTPVEGRFVERGRRRSGRRRGAHLVVYPNSVANHSLPVTRLGAMKLVGKSPPPFNTVERDTLCARDCSDQPRCRRNTELRRAANRRGRARRGRRGGGKILCSVVSSRSDKFRRRYGDTLFLFLAALHARLYNRRRRRRRRIPASLSQQAPIAISQKADNRSIVPSLLSLTKNKKKIEGGDSGSKSNRNRAQILFGADYATVAGLPF